MEKFVVPQFIDVEDKIVGPITTRQFVIVLAGGLLSFIAFKLFVFGAYIVIQILLLGLVATFGFVKVNGQPFHFFILNVIQTMKKPALRVWRKEIIAEEIKAKKAAGEEVVIPKITPKRLPESSRLSELSLIVNTGGAYKGEDT